MKRFGKWFGSSLLIVASIFMLTSILSCGGKKKNNGGTTAAAKFKITFKADPADAGTVTATVDGKAITSGAEVEKDKKVVFTLAIKDATKHELDKWDGGATAKKDNALMAELTVAKAVEVIAKLKAKGSADPALTFKSMKILNKDVAKATDGKLSVVLPAGTTKVEQTNIKEAKFMAGTKEVTDATVTLVGTPVTIDAKAQKADLKVKVAAKAGSYAETEFTIAATVEQPPIVLKEVKYAVKLDNADAKDKCSVKIYVGEKAAGATTSTFTKDEAHELKPLPPAAGADAGKLKTTVGTDLLFVVSFADTQRYRVKEWAGATVKPEPADKSEAQTTVGTADVNVTINLEAKPEELKATALKLVDKDRANWIAYEFEAGDGKELAKGFKPADSAIPEIKLDKDAWKNKKLKFEATCGSEAGVTTEVYDGTTKVEDATGLDITETAKTIKLVVQKKDNNVVKKEGVYKFKIVLAEVAKLSKIELKRDTATGASIETLSEVKFKKLCGGLEYVYLVDSNINKVAVVATAADSATVTYKYGGADCNGECTLDATKTCEISVIKKEGDVVKKAKKVYRIKFVKTGDKQNKHHIKNVKICDQTITWDDLDEAENEGANGTKIAHIVLPKSVETDLATKNKIVWENSSADCGEIKISFKKKGESAYGPEEDKTSSAGAANGVVIDSNKDKYPCEVKVVVKKNAGATAATDVTTYIFHVSIAAN